ncbi:hypothetical protein P5G51_009665 [Virgibacillus sp. 179-BFC.A HS]|uniref:Uncharacterized protein n=1 Tax=Tigheibacillus jepli TaxID=3035914 RepID=A0ABU5CIF4_9BACI|nr:hypothetical protein [Virgibacillus sp. 179-BFC.A HS]MDY0405627.1 hypothetical protein [Virgibacillus sp. 179-BFC.A HS]
MDTVYRILTVNPELSATNIGVFDEEVCIFEKTIHHQADELGKFARLWEQAAYREKEILHHLDYEGMNISKLNAVSGRGGLLHPIEGEHTPSRMIWLPI